MVYTTVCSCFHGFSVEDYFTTARKYKCNLMCSIEAYYKLHQKNLNLRVVVRHTTVILFNNICNSITWSHTELNRQFATIILVNLLSKQWCTERY